MTYLRTLLKAILLLAGAGAALVGMAWLVIAASGAVRTGQPYIAAACFLLVAVPLIVFAFSRRLAKVQATLLLLAFALAFLWLAFRPGQPIDRPALAQAGAIAFAVLLFARVGLAWRRKRLGT